MSETESPSALDRTIGPTSSPSSPTATGSRATGNVEQFYRTQ
jgi:hypothetical protein